jgi:hypothetical protein
MSIFETKRRIDDLFERAAEFGFDLRERGPGYSFGDIYLYAAPDNTVFAQDVLLGRFQSLEQAEYFLAGYAKCDLAYRMGGKK